jgi:hypothetical protein
MRIFDCEQGTQEWLDLRCGIATASEFSSILTPTTMKLSASARGYACQLIAERLIGGPDPWKRDANTSDIARGHYTESEARNFIEFTRATEIKRVGFCLHDNGRWGASPDGFIGDAEGLELKCPAPKTQVQWLLDEKLPPDHRAQVHGGMIVTGLNAWTFLSYCEGLPPLEIRVERDDYTERLHEALLEFNELYARMFNRIVEQREIAIDAAIARKGDQLDENHRGLVPPANQQPEESYF